MSGEDTGQENGRSIQSASFLFTSAFSRLTILSNFVSMSEISLAEAMKEFLNESRLKGGIQALQIQDAWEKIMGKTIARYTDKIEIVGQTLFISSTVAPLKNELLYQKEKIIERVNEALGEKVIKEVVIK